MTNNETKDFQAFQINLASSSNHLDRPKRRKFIFYLLTPRLDTYGLLRINHILGVRLRIHERGAEREGTVDNERV
jgi:hypothetical protein